jgi:hypothetical protein
MKVKNIKSGKTFETTRDFFENSIVAKGNGDKYDVTEDEAPIEVRQMREVIELKKKSSKAEKPETNND